MVLGPKDVDCYAKAVSNSCRAIIVFSSKALKTSLPRGSILANVVLTATFEKQLQPKDD